MENFDFYLEELEKIKDEFKKTKAPLREKIDMLDQICCVETCINDMMCCCDSCECDSECSETECCEEETCSTDGKCECDSKCCSSENKCACC